MGILQLRPSDRKAQKPAPLLEAMGNLANLLGDLDDVREKEIKEITPTETTDDFFRTVVVRYRNGSSQSYFLSKGEYEWYRHVVDDRRDGHQRQGPNSACRRGGK